MPKAPHIRQATDLERFEARAAAYRKAAWGHASELEHTHDPKMRAHHKKKLERAREQAAFYDQKASEVRSKT